MSEQLNDVMPVGAESIPELQRVMPFSNEAEQSIIGSMFLDKECIPDVVAKVRSSDFYIGRHAVLFDTIVELYNLGKPIDLITLEEQLTLRGKLQEIGGIKFIVEIANAVPSTENVIYYADIVKDKSVRRSLIRLTNKLSTVCYNGDMETDDILAEAQQGIINISQGRESNGLVHIGKFLNESVDLIEKVSSNDGTVSGVPTGFIDIDRRTTGLHAAELIVLAARPGVGKTSFALNIAQNAAVKHNKIVAIFNFEMPGVQLANRLLSSEAKISQERLKKGTLRDEDWGKLAIAAEVLSRSKIYIQDTSNLTVTDISANCRKLMLQEGLDLVIIDYLQLITGGSKSRNSGNRQQEISDISRTLKILAKDLNIPVIALSQLSRSSEKEKREPMLSDLRESGAIEQDADIVMFLHRDKEDTEEPNKTKCNLAKHRSGEPGYEYLTWLGEYTSFSDWSGSREQ